MGKCTFSRSTARLKEEYLEKGLRTLVLKFANFIQESDYLEARQNSLVLEPQDLSKVRWRELRGPLLIDTEHPNSFDHIKRNKVAYLPLTWEYASFMRVNRLDRWRGVGLVLIHLWSKSMEKSLHKDGGICVYLIDTPEVQVAEHLLSAQETNQFHSTGRLEFRYRESPRWLSKDIIASWAGVAWQKYLRVS
jgi:hypothetical protein